MNAMEQAYKELYEDERKRSDKRLHRFVKMECFIMDIESAKFRGSGRNVKQMQRLIQSWNGEE